MKTIKVQDYHRFIDEAGDMTFFGKNKTPILGNEGVSKVFILGMVKIKQPLSEVRTIINNFCAEIESDSFFNSMPSVNKRIKQGGYYLHAKDDSPEIRYKFLLYLMENIKFSAQVVVGRKKLSRFTNKHNSQEREFYADLLSHLLKDKANYDKLVINIAERGSSTRGKNLEDALLKAHQRHIERGGKEYTATIKFNVQRYSSEPILAITDYILWTVQRVFEKGEIRYYDIVSKNIKQIHDLYDQTKSGTTNGWMNYYGPDKPLTKDNYIESLDV